MALISVGAFVILAEGSKYLTANQMAVDAQRSGLAILSSLGADLQATKPNLISTSGQGIVLATPFNQDRSVEFDLTNSGIRWQSWVCYYYDGQDVTRRERPISTPSDPGTPPAPSSFSPAPIAKVLGTNISRFTVTQTSSVPSLWSVRLTVGSMADTSTYGIELESETGPRN